MKKTLLMLIAVIMSAYNLSSQNIRGCTYEIQTKKTFTVAGQAKEYSPAIKKESLQNSSAILKSCLVLEEFFPPITIMTSDT